MTNERRTTTEVFGREIAVADLVRGHLASATTHDDPLVALTNLRWAIEEIDEAIGRTVTEARAAGRSWSQIGDSLGISKQAAQQKYGERA